MEKKSLNFEFWRFCPDYDDLGLEQQWQFQDNQPYLEEKTRIAVPSCWDRKSAGELAEYQGIAWYWRVFSIPKSFEGKKYSLIVERMAHDVTVFVDGEEIGSFSGGFLPVEFDFSNISVGEDHFLAMRVDGREEAKRYLDPKIEEDDPLYAGAESYHGVFGNVYIETREHITLEDLKMETNLVFESDNETINYAELGVSIYLANHSAQEYNGKIRIFISRDYVEVAEEIREVNILANNSRLARIMFNVDLEDEDLWDTSNPETFDIKIEVGNNDGTIIDLSDIMVFRQFEYKDDVLYLNGKKFEGRGGVFPIDHPKYGYNLPVSYISDLMKLIKERDIAIIRPNQGTFSPIIVEMATRYGVAVVSDIPAVDLEFSEKNSFFTKYVNDVAIQGSLALWSIHPKVNEMAESDPNVRKVLVDLEKLFNSKLDSTRSFVYKGKFGVEEWEKIPRDVI